MTMRYQDGRAFEAIILSRREEVIRVLLRGAEDAIELTCRNGTWVTEDCDPVTIDFSPPPPVGVSEADCICPPSVAGELIALLYRDSPEDLPRVATAALERKQCDIGRLS